MKRSRFKLQVMLILILVGCATVKNNCDNGLREEKSNSSQTLKAIRYGRSCRHGDSVSLNISILPNKTPMPNSEGNILIANFKAGTMNLFVTDTSVLIAWLNDSTLQLTLDKGLHVVKKESSFGEAKVVYQTK